MLIGVLFVFFFGILPVLLGTYLISLYVFKDSKKILIFLYSIPVVLIMFIGGYIVYERNYHFVKSTDIPYESQEVFYLGDAIEDVKNFYGANYYSTVEQGMNVIGYVDRKRRVNLVFWHNQVEIDSVWVRRME
ncbi:hypothetical protein [Bacillus alkalisoli]|uniref:hypothetical protein n=1 Tax=Bacillus alkalisoli TaxID=2011008 RepID=UPI000C2406A1|nr:hypothetical protein [Bacillus alkalisoli]